MEYLASKSLATVLSERGTLPPTKAAQIGAQIASALVSAVLVVPMAGLRWAEGGAMEAVTALEKRVG